MHLARYGRLETAVAVLMGRAMFVPLLKVLLIARTRLKSRAPLRVRLRKIDRLMLLYAGQRSLG